MKIYFLNIGYVFFFNVLERLRLLGDVAHMGKIKMHTQFQ